ncbi:uncharacterized protein LOC114332164 [Diabrotica virgifera virgifera]|uniref:MADF domain-containing protein n=1 Tax=Diabrotica virgifera virgifera TaxID=50390 RepID=A0ABM5JY20_DIAVI|nr:uncharacterized protein LOC114332164 [Diabrotica virgifera virgifera]
MEWSKELTTRLIELFREQRVLWDPTFMDFKNRNKKHDAWTEIAAEVKTDTSEVEKKMRMLIGQFQRELKKGKSGDEVDAHYKTKWLFFNMLFFLKDKNEARHSTECGLSPKQYAEPQDTRNINAAEVRLKQPFENNKKRKNESESDMREFVKACTTTLNTPEKEYDEFDNICMAFAAKMRKMDPIQQIWTESLMHKIVTYGLLGKLNDNMDIVDTGYNS